MGRTVGGVWGSKIPSPFHFRSPLSGPVAPGRNDRRRAGLEPSGDQMSEIPITGPARSHGLLPFCVVQISFHLLLVRTPVTALGAHPDGPS